VVVPIDKQCGVEAVLKYNIKSNKKGPPKTGSPFLFSENFYLFVCGAIRNLRANRITITNASAITISPGTPYSSAIPVPANAVVVGSGVSLEARAAWVYAAPTVAVAAAWVPPTTNKAGSIVLVAEAAAATGFVAVGVNVDVVVGKMAA
jgi:hypothetical protein